MRHLVRVDRHVQTDEIRIFEILRPTSGENDQHGSVLQTDWDITRKISCPEPEIIQNIVTLYANGDQEVSTLRNPFEDSYFRVDSARKFTDLKTAFCSLADQISFDLQTAFSYEQSFQRFISVITEPNRYFSPFWTLKNNRPTTLETYLLCYLILADQILAFMFAKRLSEFVVCYIVIKDIHHSNKHLQEGILRKDDSNANLIIDEESEHFWLVQQVCSYISNESVRELAVRFFDGFAEALNAWRTNISKPMTNQQS